MTTPFKPATLALFALVSALLNACFVEDPGPRQKTEHQYSVVDFDRLEIGSGLHIDVAYGNYYSVKASGDRRNVEDLIVRKEGSTLIIDYKNFRERRYDTFIEITMPELNSVNFSAGSESRVDGFVANDRFDAYLSGGSVCQLNVETAVLRVILSGASYLSARGTGDRLEADISGSSAMRAFNFPVAHAALSISGSSDGEVAVTDMLEVTASGASHLIYRGSPSVTSEVSGSSLVHQE